jgi:hypothetical protein
MNYDDALLVLGLTPENCTLVNVKKAYAQAAKANRPEIAPERFAKIRLAYERVQEALQTGTVHAFEHETYAANDARFAANDAYYHTESAISLVDAIADKEGFDLSRPVNDEVLEQHRQEVLLLNKAWITFLPAFRATAQLPEAQRSVAQMTLLSTLFQAKALDHYLSRQTLGEKLGWVLLKEAGDWVCLDALKLTMKTFAYETYGWHNHSWTQHSLLETKSDTLREKMIFQLNAKQEHTAEYRLSHTMGVLPFASLWFFKRKQTKQLKSRLSLIQKKYGQWAHIMHPTQVWRVENWPSTLAQLICFLFGLVSVPASFFLMSFIRVRWLSTANQSVAPAIKPVVNAGLVNGVIEVLVVVGGAISFALLYMTLYTYLSHAFKTHYRNFTKDIILDSENDAIDNKGAAHDVRLSMAQKGYRACRRVFTLNFFGSLEAIAVVLLLILLPWQRIQAFSPEMTQLYPIASAGVGICSFIYLRYLSKRQRVAPNHPYLCGAILSAGFYLLQTSGGLSSAAAVNPANTVSNSVKWMNLILFSIFIRSQFPSFLKVDWSQPLPSWLMFNRFVVLEKTAVKVLSSISGLLVMTMWLLGGMDLFKTTPVMTSLTGFLLYLWLVVNADMDTPVMTLPIKITTLVVSTLVLSIRLYYPVAIAGFDWILSVALLMSMSWYWAYGFYEKYFERWELTHTPIPHD